MLPVQISVVGTLKFSKKEKKAKLKKKNSFSIPGKSNLWGLRENICISSTSQQITVDSSESILLRCDHVTEYVAKMAE